MTKTKLPAAEEQTALIAEPVFTVETSPSDMVIPFLKVIQSQADEVTKGKDKYNEDVRPGDIYDATTRTIYKDAELIVCGIKKYYGEWEGDVRGKLIAKHRIDSDVIKNAKRIPMTSPKGTPYVNLETADGHKLIETFGVVCIVKQNGVIVPATFTLSKTAFAVGRALNTMLTMHQTAGVPKFKLSTNLKQNDKGSWFVPVFDFVGYETEQSAIALAKQINLIVDQIIFSFSAGEADTTSEAVNEDVV